MEETKIRGREGLVRGQRGQDGEEKEEEEVEDEEEERERRREGEACRSGGEGRVAILATTKQ